MKEKTVVLGASNNPSRYSYAACQMLYEKGKAFVPVGIKKGEIFDQPILHISARPKIESVDTITIYMNQIHQKEYYDYILALNPRRIIFNPGAENPELRNLAQEKGINTEFSCTLVLLSAGLY